MKYDVCIFCIFYFFYCIQAQGADDSTSESTTERTSSDASTQINSIDPALLAYQVTIIINIKKHAQFLREKQRALGDLAFQATQKPCRCCIPKGPSLQAQILAEQITEHQISSETWKEELVKIHKKLPRDYRRTIHDIL